MNGIHQFEFTKNPKIEYTRFPFYYKLKCLTRFPQTQGVFAMLLKGRGKFTISKSEAD